MGRKSIKNKRRISTKDSWEWHQTAATGGANGSGYCCRCG